MSERFENLSSYDADYVSLEKKIRSLKNESKILQRQKNDLSKQLRETRNDLAKLKRAPLVMGYVVESLGDLVVVRSTTGPQFVVHYSNNINEEDLLPGVPIALNQRYFSAVRILPAVHDPVIRCMEIDERPSVNYSEIGGLDNQVLEVIEAIELSLKHPDLFQQIGIEPPKGVLLFGPPGNGKTLIAKAVASQTNTPFLYVNGPELVQKYIGEGARLVKELFQYAKKKSPAIVFIDEIDAIGARRTDMSTSGDREIQRTFMQLLAEMDGFNARGNIKIIGSTNREDILDPALIRPGRFDRLVTVPLPDQQGRLEILKIHTRGMNLRKNIDFSILTSLMEEFSGSAIKSVCQEAGLHCIRSKRVRVQMKDFLHAIKKEREKMDRNKEKNSNNLSTYQ